MRYVNIGAHFTDLDGDIYLHTRFLFWKLNVYNQYLECQKTTELRNFISTV